jgi:hypothetical protein
MLVSIICLHTVAAASSIYSNLPLVRQLYKKSLHQVPDPGAVPRGPLFKRSFTGIPDTLEIFVMYVEFKEEVPDDNPSTTGKGTFNSAEKDTFDLDPSGKRRYRYYLDRHMQFARDYFDKISNGRLVITWRMFPTVEQ